MEDVKQKFSKVKSIPISEIKIRKEIFQGRSEAYSKSTYEKIMREGFDKSQEPLIVWKDKARDEYVVISGHSRLAAAQDLYNAGQDDLAVLNVKEFLGDKDEAIKYALLESNRSGTAEGLISDVKAYQKAVSTGCNKECLKGYFKADSYINTLERLSNLNIEGDFLQNLNDPSQAKLYPKLQQYAEWTGELRKHFTKITDRHENEIFKFVFLEVGKILPKQDFTDMITKVVSNLAFNSNNPLNLNKAQEKSIFQEDAAKNTQILEAEKLELENILEKKHKAYARSENKTTLDLLWTEIIGANQQLIKKHKQINNIKGDLKEAENSSLDLFATTAAIPTTSFEKEEKEEKAPKTTTKTTPDVVFLNKVIEIDEAAFEPFDKGNYKEFSDKVNAFLRQYWRSENDFDTITNTQSGFVIGFDNTGIDELSGARRGETKMKALSQIKRIIEDASLFTVREEKKNNIDFLAIYTFITYIKYKGQTYEYQFVVKHKAQGKFIYAVNLDIRKPLN